MCHKAIKNKKTQQFAKIAKQVLAHNGIVEDKEKPLMSEEIGAMLQSQEKRSPYYNTYERYFIWYERGNFFVKMQEVVYGNCQTCFRAMPLGYRCKDCATKYESETYAKAVYVYPAENEEEEFAYKTLESLQETGKKPLDPIELSFEKLGLTPVVDMA